MVVFKCCVIVFECWCCLSFGCVLLSFVVIVVCCVGVSCSRLFLAVVCCHSLLVFVVGCPASLACVCGVIA